MVIREQGGNTAVTVKDARGEDLTTHEDILRCFTEFYSTLYMQQDGHDEAGIATILDEVQPPVVDDNMREMLNALTDESDKRWPIKQMNTGKTPGNDGLTNEFFKEYVDLLCTLLLAMY
ncbi:hypothetical protein NDU88_004364 [Pleurodeles waltl]|uniref:Uncharacterized protein n=1 Tax=Pleurodeles waltl TaxID=8319 RepID=A0AAV7T7M1_PLEWA|nr:hypothetical protein NDU88_004364 [Pleurodeles waltl]